MNYATEFDKIDLTVSERSRIVKHYAEVGYIRPIVSHKKLIVRSKCGIVGYISASKPFRPQSFKENSHCYPIGMEFAYTPGI